MVYEARLQLNPSSSDARKIMAEPYVIHNRLLAITPTGHRVLWRHMDKNVVIRSTTPLNWQKFDQTYPEIADRRHWSFASAFQPDQHFLFNCLTYARGKFTFLNSEKTERSWTPREADGYLDWLRARESQYGFEVKEASVLRQPWYHVQTSSGPITLMPAELLGVLKIVNKALFKASFEQGIGRMRGYGCGLLLLRPLDE